jgi:glycosyltransferase involved in cell wall biosynthesis
MVIAYLLQDTGAVYGAERATIDLASGLAARGADLRIILIRETRLGLTSSALEAAFRAKGLSVVAVATTRRFSIGLIRRIGQLLAREGVQVLHTVGYKADVHGFFARGRVPQVSTVHGWLYRRDLKEKFYGWLNVRALAHCAKVVVLSRHYEDLLKKQGLRVTRIPSGLDTSGFGFAEPHCGTFTVGMMGRFSEEKNHEMLLRATKRLVEQRVTVDVLLAGDGPLRGAVEAGIAKLDLRHAFKVKGYVAREDFFGSVDVLVLCSRIENLPYSIMEAMASGLPVVATRVGGIPDLVEDGVTGYLVETDDDAALAGRIMELSRDRALAVRLGAAGRKKIEDSFTPGTCVDAHERLYASLL